MRPGIDAPAMLPVSTVRAPAPARRRGRCRHRRAASSRCPRRRPLSRHGTPMQPPAAVFAREHRPCPCRPGPRRPARARRVAPILLDRRFDFVEAGEIDRVVQQVVSVERAERPWASSRGETGRTCRTPRRCCGRRASGRVPLAATPVQCVRSCLIGVPQDRVANRRIAGLDVLRQEVGRRGPEREASDGELKINANASSRIGPHGCALGSVPATSAWKRVDQNCTSTFRMSRVVGSLRILAEHGCRERPEGRRRSPARARSRHRGRRGRRRCRRWPAHRRYARFRHRPPRSSRTWQAAQVSPTTCPRGVATLA